MTGEDFTFLTGQVWRSPFKKGWPDSSLFTTSGSVFLKSFPHLLRGYLSAHQVESSLQRRGLWSPRLLGCLWKRIRKFLCQSDSELSSRRLRELGDQDAVKGILGFQGLEPSSARWVGCQRMSPVDESGGHWAETKHKGQAVLKSACFPLRLHWNQQVSGKCDNLIFNPLKYFF